MEYLLIWLAFGVVSAMIANSKGNSGCAWFVVGVLLGPIGLLMSFFTSDNEKEKNFQKGNTKKCPYCAEYVKEEAIVCKHCGRSLGRGDSDFDIERYRTN
jgi:hypothetical protein